jgi:hypothetical protein
MFTRLNDENYDTWAFETRAELKRKGVIAIVDGIEGRPPGSDNHKVVKAWAGRRDLGSAEIIRRLEPGQFPHVVGYEDELDEMWTRLREFHMASGLGSIVAIWRKFQRMAKADNATMHAHISSIRTLANKLSSLGDAPSEAQTVAVLLGSLPPEYNTLVIVLDLHANANDIDFVIGRVLNEENRQKDGGNDNGTSRVSHSGAGTSTTQALYSGTRGPGKFVDESKITCFKCGEVGHFQSRCLKPGPLVTHLSVAAPSVVHANFANMGDETTYYTF